MDIPNITIISYMFLLLFLQTLQLSSSHSVRSDLTDLQSLLAFKDQITHDPLDVLRSWNQSLHFCQWSGVTCADHHRRVAKLELNSSQLHGTIFLHVGNLSFLRILNLQQNSFTHDIPHELGKLFRLRNLLLLNNSFSGVIPANISRCSNLLWLQLGGNNLTGKLPEQLGTLSKLQKLDFGQNNLVGKIPLSLGNLSSIQIIYGDKNHLEGGIPTSLGNLNNLSSLGLDSNNLTGTIPPSIYNLSSLTLLSLTDNRLHGSLLPSIGQTLPHLEYFNIHSNNFSGKIPVTISNASLLCHLELSDNSGEVPSLTSLQNLRRSLVASNDLGRGEADDLSFLNSLANNEIFELLDVQDNNFGGELLRVVSNFSKILWMMALGENQIHGNIPREIGNLTGLEVLHFEVNQLTVYHLNW